MYHCFLAVGEPSAVLGSIEMYVLQAELIALLQNLCS